MTDIDNYQEEKKCEYKNRLYSVRDNGAVYRHHKEGAKPSLYDDSWTFGKMDLSTGYMMIASERVHRIVATAFYGTPEFPDLVVDHIDTNRCNNRPENLRWVTRLQNTLDNPITRAKIELICGSIEAFIENPALLYGHESEDYNFSWMRCVTRDEAKASYERWVEWSEKPLEERKSKGYGVGEWLYSSNLKTNETIVSDIASKINYSASEKWSKYTKFNSDIFEDTNTHTENIKRWKIKMLDRTTESFFPLAPISTTEEDDVLERYMESLIPGSDFLVSRYYYTILKEVVHFAEERKLRILSERVDAQRTPLYIFEIYADNDIIYHKFVGLYSKSKLKLVEEAMHDLSKFNREEWKYTANKPRQDK